MAPSHYLNQCWLLIGKALWHSSEGIIIRKSEDTNQPNKIENGICKMASTSPWGQWVNAKSKENQRFLLSVLCLNGAVLQYID